MIGNPLDRSIYYRLNAKHEPEACTAEEWGQYFEAADPHVAQTNVAGYWVSTVFLGLDHSYSGTRPVLFETMTFAPDGGEFDCARYCTWRDAELGHAQTVAQIKRDRWRRPHLWAWRLVRRGMREVELIAKGAWWLVYGKAAMQRRREARDDQAA